LLPSNVHEHGEHPRPAAYPFLKCNYNDGLSFSWAYEMHAESPVRASQYPLHNIITCLLIYTGCLAILSYLLVNYRDKIPPTKFVNLYRYVGIFRRTVAIITVQEVVVLDKSNKYIYILKVFVYPVSR